jgi:hypothetical protein
MEPVFVPRRGAAAEDDGYLMAYVFNSHRHASDVVILSAQDFSAAPLAVVELPVRVPFGFHGDWIPDALSLGKRSGGRARAAVSDTLAPLCPALGLLHISDTEELVRSSRSCVVSGD